jgi:S1-C subfamily serine protease
VPVDLLKPILNEMLAQGRSAQSQRAWMGVNCIEIDGEVRVLRVNSPSPAEAAGLRPGDRIVRIDGQAVDTLDTLWQRLWTGGAAERDVSLDIQREGRPMQVPLHTVDRQSTLKQPLGT